MLVAKLGWSTIWSGPEHHIRSGLGGGCKWGGVASGVGMAVTLSKCLRTVLTIGWWPANGPSKHRESHRELGYGLGVQETILITNLHLNTGSRLHVILRVSSLSKSLLLMANILGHAQLHSPWASSTCCVVNIPLLSYPVRPSKQWHIPWSCFHMLNYVIVNVNSELTTLLKCFEYDF